MTKQRSFASLTEEEINQVAVWLPHGTISPPPITRTLPIIPVLPTSTHPPLLESQRDQKIWGKKLASERSGKWKQIRGGVGNAHRFVNTVVQVLRSRTPHYYDVLFSPSPLGPLGGESRVRGRSAH